MVPSTTKRRARRILVRSNRMSGCFAQAFYGGRAEVKIRKTPVPICLVDFSSQYPLVQSLLGNQEVFTAERITFEDATDDVRKRLHEITLDDCFNPEIWRNFRFVALVLPDNDILPVRTEYDGDGVTKNIGVNYFTSATPFWYSSGDVIWYVKLLYWRNNSHRFEIGFSNTRRRNRFIWMHLYRMFFELSL